MRPACNNPIIVQNSIKTERSDNSVKFDYDTNTLVDGKMPIVISWSIAKKIKDHFTKTSKKEIKVEHD